MKREKILLFAVLLMCFYLLHALLKPVKLEETSSGENYKCSDCNVILIIIDALRPDHLGCYGYYRNTTPNIDKLASQGLLFKQAISQGPSTLLSVPSILTSLYPSVHRVSVNRPLGDNILTLAEILKKHGHATAGFVEGGYTSSFFGLDKGFDVYDEKGIWNRSFGGIKNINERVFDWIEENSKNKLFLYLHYMDVHSPFNPPEPYFSMYDPFYNGTLNLTWKSDRELNLMNLSKRDVEHVISAYDGGIRYTDEHVGKLLKKLEELNLTRKTIIIFTADHGEALGEHGKFGHGRSLYDEEIQIPLILKIPSIRAKKVNDPVQSIDILPTILDILSIPIPDQAQGQSLLPLVKGKEISRSIYSENHPLVSIRKDNFKLIYNIEMNRKEELYDLKNDPKEHINLVDENLIVADELEGELLEWLKSNEKLSELFHLNDTTWVEDEYPKIIVPVVELNESLEIISANLDIIYERDEWPQEWGASFSKLPQDFWLPWYSNGYYWKEALPENSTHKGIVILVPQNWTQPRFLLQNITLNPNNRYVLVAELANVGKYIYPACECSKAIVKIKISYMNQEEAIYEGIIDAKDGWKTLALDISKYAGSNITFKIEGHAGGPCVSWCSFCAAVDKFYVGKSRGKLKISKTIEEKIQEKLRELGYIE